MSLPRVMLAVIATALLAGQAVAVPPQPPLTTAVASEWRDELLAVHSLSDNVFLYEEAAGEFRRRLAAWQGADALLSLNVIRVTKDAVLCNALPFGHVAILNEQQPVADERTGESLITLRIGDVVPLDVARRLRTADKLVIRGIVAASSYQPRQAIELTIGKAHAVAVVARSYSGSPSVYASSRRDAAEFLAAPEYPHPALAAGADGLVVVTVQGREKPKLSTSAGHAALDEAALSSIKQLENNLHLFPGEHRFAFTILR